MSSSRYFVYVHCRNATVTVESVVVKVHVIPQTKILCETPCVREMLYWSLQDRTLSLTSQPVKVLHMQILRRIKLLMEIPIQWPKASSGGE